MAPRLWDPYKVLNITGRNSNMMHCVGHVAICNGARCRREIPSDNFAEVLLILGKMETKPPAEISSKTLSRLARLSLCGENHQNQRNRILDEWEEEIEAATKEYERLEKWKRRYNEISAMNKRLLAQLEESSKQEESQDSEAETCVDEVSERLERQLNSERQAFETYKKDVESARKSQVMAETALRIKLAQAENVSAQQVKDIRRLTHQEHDLLKQTKELESSLARERKESEIILEQRDELREDLSALSAEMGSIQEKLSTEGHNLGKIKEKLIEAKKNEESSLKTVESLRSEIVDVRMKNDNLYAELKATRTQELSLREQLLNERQDLDHLKKALDDIEAKKALDDIEAKKAAIFEETEQLRSQLEGERRQSEQQSETFSRDIRNLTAQIASQHEETDRLNLELGTMKTENVSVASQLSTERQTSSQLQKSLDQANTMRASLIEQTKGLQIDFETLFQESEKLKHQLVVTKTQEVELTKQLEDQVIAATSRDAIWLTEKGRMLEQIANLEMYSISRVLRGFGDRLRKFIKSTVVWLTARRLRRQTAGGTELEQDVA